MKISRHNLLTCFVVLIAGVLVSGCSIRETYRKLIGTSMQALEEQARTNGISQSFECSYEACFRTVMAMASPAPSNIPWKQPKGPDTGDFKVLMSDLYSSPPYIDVIGVKGNVDTTEVGIFFTRTSLTTIRVTVSSLASSAKRKVSDLIFTKLGEEFKKVD